MEPTHNTKVEVRIPPTYRYGYDKSWHDDTVYVGTVVDYVLASCVDGMTVETQCRVVVETVSGRIVFAEPQHVSVWGSPEHRRRVLDYDRERSQAAAPELAVVS